MATATRSRRSLNGSSNLGDLPPGWPSNAVRSTSPRATPPPRSAPARPKLAAGHASTSCADEESASQGRADPTSSAESGPPVSTTTSGAAATAHPQRAKLDPTLPKNASKLVSLLAKERALDNPTRAGCEAVLARVRNSLQGMLPSDLRKSVKALIEYNQQKYPMATDQTFQEPMRLVVEHAMGHHSADGPPLNVLVFSAQDGAFGRLLRDRWAQQQQLLPQLELRMNDLLCDERSSVYGLGVSGDPLLANGEPDVPESKDIVVSRCMFQQMNLGFVSMRAMVEQLRPPQEGEAGGMLLLAFRRQQVRARAGPR